MKLQAECDLRVAQSEFDRQAEITKLLLEGISTSQSSHLRHLHAFVEAQVKGTMFLWRHMIFYRPSFKYSHKLRICQSKLRICLLRRALSIYR